MNTYPDFLVRIDCMTYNHAPYIEDAMNGFCMQQTTFPFVATIIDDASTDGEPEVIRNYLNVHFDLSEEGLSRQWENDDAYFIYAQHLENKNCYFAVVLLKYNFYSIKKSKAPLIKDWTNTKYVALCEGDDYWISPQKLQLQVDVLSSKGNVGIVITDFDIYFENEKRFQNDIFENSFATINKKDPVLSYGFLGNPTWVYINDHINYNPHHYLDGALCLFYGLSSKYDIEVLPITTSVYRRHIGSASCFSSIEKDRDYHFKKSIFMLRLEYAQYFCNTDEIKKTLFSEGLWGIYWNALQWNDYDIIDLFNDYFEKIDFDVFNIELRNANYYKRQMEIITNKWWYKTYIKIATGLFRILKGLKNL